MMCSIRINTFLNTFLKNWVLLTCVSWISLSLLSNGQQTSKSSGILTADEIINSPVLQSHLNSYSDHKLKIFSSYFLREYITTQCESLKYFGSEKEHFLPWALTQTKTNQVVKYTEKKCKCQKEKRKVPRYKYKYRYVEKTIYVREESPNSSISDSDTSQRRSGKLVKRTVTVREVVSKRQVGYKTISVLVPDEKGRYEKTVFVPIINKHDVVSFNHGWYATNAQVLYTMLKSGLSSTDAQVSLKIQSFNNLLYAYGLPDSTEDLAWLTALFSNLPQNNPATKYWTDRLISKLISGSATIGNQKGMWGPVCVNAAYIAKMNEYDNKFVTKKIKPLEHELLLETRKRSRERIQQKLNKIQLEYDLWQQIYLSWAMSGASSSTPRIQTIIPANRTGQLGQTFNFSLRAPGQLQDPYHFQFIDLESTCLALFAISEASVNKVLPKLTIPPVDHNGRKYGKQINVKEQLEACLHSLNGIRLPDGGWSSSYSVKYKSFSRDIPNSSELPNTIYNSIKQNHHWAYNVLGIASMRYLSKSLGVNKSKKIHATIVDFERKLVTRLLKRSSTIDLLDSPSGANILYHLAEITSGNSKEAIFLWQEIGSRIFEETKDLAKMTVGNNHATYAAKQSLQAEADYIKNNKNKDRRFIMEPMSNTHTSQQMNVCRINELSVRASFVYFLSSGLRQPLFAMLKKDKSSTKFPALDYYASSSEHKTPFKFFTISSLKEIGYYSSSLFVVTETSSDWTLSMKEKNNLTTYIEQHQGIIICAGTQGIDISSTIRQVNNILSNTQLAIISKKTSHRGAPCIEFWAHNKLRAIIIDASQDSSKKQTYSNRLHCYKSLLKENKPKDYDQSNYCLLPQYLSFGELRATGFNWKTEQEAENQ